ncbi:MAG: pyruvate dehydrogenase (acetyl-transferring) E1 component subunit alpha [Promethearchaeota archaeon]
MSERNIPNIDSETLLDMYRVAFTIRQFEQRVYDEFNLNKIPGTMHLYLGEEAVATGVCANLTREDYLTSTHRGHGHVIAKGGDLKRMMAELFGRTTGYCKGKGGSMHIADFTLGILGANGVVGGGIPIAVGAGLSCKLKYPGRVVACFFGDGASNQGANFHGAVNLAAIWDLPVVFVCENNLYAMGTPQRTAMKVKDVAERAAAYGIPGVVADGMDVVDVYLKAKEAVERARRGEGPTLLECKTYRIKGHSKFDPAKYRPPEEVEAWLARDAVATYRARLLDSGRFSPNQIGDVETQVLALIDEAVEFAESSPLPRGEDALTDVYAGDYQ